MTRDEAATYLNGREYRDEVDFDFSKKLKASGLIAVYGASDDIMCMDGVESDEFYGPVKLNRLGALRSVCDDDCPYFEKLALHYPTVIPIWHDNVGQPAWTYKIDFSDIPYSIFEIIEDDEVYCVGIVIDTKDLPE